MKMVKVIDKKDSTIIETEKTLKAFGAVLFRKTERFIQKQGKSCWISLSSKKTASKREAKKLDFWLHNHRKYVTGTING